MRTQTLTRAELMERVIQLKRLTNRAEVESLIDSFFGAITETLGQGEVVRLSGFGNFYLLDKNARPGRNPKTGEKIPVSARRVVTFRTGNKLKELIELFSSNEMSNAKKVEQSEQEVKK